MENKSLKALLEGDINPLGKILNGLAFIRMELGEGSWVGLYLYDPESDVLRLGPFQGTPACEEIAPGRGVVGVCYKTKKTMYVPDVSVFPGYICCDASAKSEYVCPLYQDGSLVGVFDVDSPELDGLKGKEDYLKECAELLSALPFPSVE